MGMGTIGGTDPTCATDADLWNRLGSGVDGSGPRKVGGAVRGAGDEDCVDVAEPLRSREEPGKPGSVVPDICSGSSTKCLLAIVFAKRIFSVPSNRDCRRGLPLKALVDGVAERREGDIGTVRPVRGPSCVGVSTMISCSSFSSASS